MLHPTELPFLDLLRDAGMSPREIKFASLQAALVPNGARRDVYVLELALQRQLEKAVAEAAFLHDNAAAAYQSYLRGYAAHSKVVKKLVHVGQLHLGHLARSYGLKEIPSRLHKQQQKRKAGARSTGGGGRGRGGGGGCEESGEPQRPKKLRLAERLSRQPKAGSRGAGTGPIGGATLQPRSVSVSEFGAG